MPLIGQQIGLEMFDILLKNQRQFIDLSITLEQKPLSINDIILVRSSTVCLKDILWFTS